jgi:hypothetical protein
MNNHAKFQQPSRDSSRIFIALLIPIWCNSIFLSTSTQTAQFRLITFLHNQVQATRHANFLTSLASCHVNFFPTRNVTSFKDFLLSSAIVGWVENIVGKITFEIFSFDYSSRSHNHALEIKIKWRENNLLAGKSFSLIIPINLIRENENF